MVGRRQSLVGSRWFLVCGLQSLVSSLRVGADGFENYIKIKCHGEVLQIICVVAELNL